ncbi:sigma-70 family RNA polymerase sigma factor [Nocardia acidivorans]|uniref:sigma-70 family RNA polymerase sigma factor n=1 Tax=Nocardia acidivorans TaxID=404580 RepID=UPI000A06F9BB|nr:sigma-70 family RNA polymerase sigma factor [Nocardia acidivorans]
MTSSDIRRAHTPVGSTSMTVSAEFASRTAPFRPELLAHCYRMLGSIHEAEDLVQETMLRAWRAADRFDERKAGLRTWLYRIATNACLTALDQRGKRALPTGLVGPSQELVLTPPRHPEISWLEPIPDALLGDSAADPAAVVAARSGIRLAFIAALQYLPARQRAVLILRDVLAWSAAEVADLLETSPAAINSALQRAHAHLEKVAPMLDRMSESLSPQERQAVDRYMHFFGRSDMRGLAELLRDDVVLEMPPALVWFAGRADVLAFFTAKTCSDPDRWRCVGTAANTQPAAACYQRDDAGIYRAQSIHVLTVKNAAIDKITVFLGPQLFERFGLPATLE